MDDTGKELIPQYEIPRMTSEQAREIFKKMQLIDSDTIQQLSDLGEFVGFPDALDVLSRQIILRSDYTTTSPNHYIVGRDLESDERQLISVTLPRDEAVQYLSDLSSKEDRSKYLNKVTASKISISAGNKLDQYKSDFILSYQRQQTTNNDRVDEIYIDSKDENGKYVGVRFNPQTTSFRKPEDYQLIAKSIQKVAGILLDWDVSIHADSQLNSAPKELPQ